MVLFIEGFVEKKRQHLATFDKEYAKNKAE